MNANRNTLTRTAWPHRAVAALLLAGFATCANLTHIDVTTAGKGDIPAGTVVDTLLGDISFAGLDKIDFSEEFKNQGVTKDQVNSVHLKSMTLSVDAPDSGNFDFIDSIAFSAASSGLPSLQIASLTPVPKGAKTLSLTVATSAELKPYVVAPSMQITASVKGSRPSQDTKVSVQAVLDVDVHVPGCN